jgi:hypothetical protein
MSKISDDKTYIYKQQTNSPVQYGRPDSSASSQEASNQLQQTSNTAATEAKNFQASQTTDVKPQVESPYEIDLLV